MAHTTTVHPTEGTSQIQISTTNEPSEKAIGDFLIVYDDTCFLRNVIYNQVIGICQELTTRTQLEDGYVVELTDRDQVMTVMKTEKALFLMGPKTPETEERITKWVTAVEGLNETPRNFFIVYVDASGSPEISTSPNTIFIDDYSKVFKWWPQVLMFLFGKKTHTVEKPQMLNIADSALSKQILNPYEAAVTNLLAVFGLGGNAISDRHMILFCDNLNKLPEKETENALRENKISGGHIHVLALKKTEDVDHYNWISNWQNTVDNCKKFILVLLIDLELIDVSRKYIDAEAKLPTTPKGPIKFEKSSVDTVVLRWETQDTEQKIPSPIRAIIKSRKQSDGDWIHLADKYPGHVLSYKARNLENSTRYQFSVTLENYEGRSEPLLSEWISIEELKNKWNTLLKICLILIWILVIILDIIQAVLVVTILVSLIALPYFLAIYLGKDKLLDKSDKYFALIFINLRVSVFCILVLFAVGYASSGWMFTFNKDFGPTSNEDLRPTSKGLVLYVIPTLYLVVWSVAMNFILYKVFQFKNGVFTLASKLWSWGNTLNFRIHTHGNTMEVV